MIDRLGTTAAMALRDAVENAITTLESKASSFDLEKLGKLTPEVKAYFEAQQNERLMAISELKHARKMLHGRVFDSIKE